MKSSNIGGQAVMEGIMMRHKDKYAIAVRRPDKEIELKVEDYKCTFGKAAFLKWPIIRGVVSFVDGLVVGTKCLMYSAEIAGDEEAKDSPYVSVCTSFRHGSNRLSCMVLCRTVFLNKRKKVSLSDKKTEDICR